MPIPTFVIELDADEKQCFTDGLSAKNIGDVVRPLQQQLKTDAALIRKVAAKNQVDFEDVQPAMNAAERLEDSLAHIPAGEVTESLRKNLDRVKSILRDVQELKDSRLNEH